MTDKKELAEQILPMLQNKKEAFESLMIDYAWEAWKFAANAYRMYPDQKHTFSDARQYLLDYGRKQFQLDAAQPLQPSLEEKKEDYVVGDINTDVSSVASHSCADSNSIEQETIICSAIHFDDGKEYEHQPKNIKTGFVVAGRRHHNCYNVLASLGQALNLEERVRVLIGVMGRDSQGFITNTDRFVDRKEGWKIAKAAGQIKHGLKVYENGDDSILISENLYSEDLY